jgi:hypothetical protein
LFGYVACVTVVHLSCAFSGMWGITKTQEPSLCHPSTGVYSGARFFAPTGVYFALTIGDRLFWKKGEEPYTEDGQQAIATRISQAVANAKAWQPGLLSLPRPFIMFVPYIICA